VRQEKLWIEVEIRTDILFASGESQISPTAVNVLQQIATILKPFPNPVRVEGHTDNRPITTKAFPSNWELSAARAASVVHLFTQAGMDPQRLEIIGLGEFRPIADNATQDGRNTNRRVRIVVLEGAGVPEEVYAARRQQGAPADAAAGMAEPGANRFLLSVPPADLSGRMQPGAPAPDTQAPAPESQAPATENPKSGKPPSRETVYSEPQRPPATGQ
jgi:chemotaxis protein MotB